jgi:hypothetical protein
VIENNFICWCGGIIGRRHGLRDRRKDLRQDVWAKLGSTSSRRFHQSAFFRSVDCIFRSAKRASISPKALATVPIIQEELFSRSGVFVSIASNFWSESIEVSAFISILGFSGLGFEGSVGFDVGYFTWKPSSFSFFATARLYLSRPG